MALVAFSCTDGNELEYEAFGYRHDKTLADYEDVAASNDPSRPDFAPVVFFTYSLDGTNNEEYVASGTLINAEWVLTAGHNFFDAQEQNSPAPVSGLEVRIGNDPNTTQAVYAVAEVVYHPTWRDGQQDYQDANDLCLVRLATPVADVAPAILYTTTTESLDSEVWFCGFGDYTEWEGGDVNSFSKKHAMANRLDRAVEGFSTQANGTTYAGGLLAFDFDDPDGIVNSLGDDYVGEDEELLGEGSSQAVALEYEGTTVQGDSGGPLFVKNGDNWQLAGVLTGGANRPIRNHRDGDYGDISIFTRVSTSIEWIKSVVE